MAKKAGGIKESLATYLMDRIDKAFHSEDLLSPLYADTLITGYNDTFMNSLDSIILEFNQAFGLNWKVPNEFFSMQPPYDNPLNPSTVDTGVGDYRKIGTFYKWQNSTSLPYWTNSTCTKNKMEYERLANSITGSEGILFNPDLPETDIPIFADWLLRSVNISQTDTINGDGDGLFGDMTLKRYRINSRTFANSSEVAQNCGFGPQGPFGAFNVTEALNAPILFSNPVFDGADTFYLMNTTGLTGYTGDTSVYDIDPWSGAAFRIHHRVQVNVRVDQMVNFKSLRFLKPGGYYLPVAVMDERFVATQAFVDVWESEFGHALTTAANARLAGLIVGSFLLAIALCLVVVSFARCSRVENVEVDEETVNERRPLLDNVAVNNSN